MRNHLSLIVVALGLALSIGTASADELSNGEQAYAAGEYAEAVKWFRLVAEQGDALAQFNLGNMYYNGRGVPEDDAEAVRWYRLAAEQGNASAQSNLGITYILGLSVVQSNVIALMLFNLADAQGDEDAVEYRDIISVEMTARDISKAQEMARVCLENNYKGCGF